VLSRPWDTLVFRLLVMNEPFRPHGYAREEKALVSCVLRGTRSNRSTPDTKLRLLVVFGCVYTSRRIPAMLLLLLLCFDKPMEPYQVS
jgi:hypothetical protein